MRVIENIIIHCSATPEGRDVSVNEIRDWHVKGNGWSDIGYHYIVTLDGGLHIGRNIEAQGAHARGHNSTSIGICYVGGIDNISWKPKDTRTHEQKKTLVTVIKYLIALFPDAKVIGHCDVSSKACPSFDAKIEYRPLWFKLSTTRNL